MKFNISARFGALFGLAATEAPAPLAQAASAGRSRSNKRIPRSRTPGDAQPSGSKLARMAAEHRIGGRTSL